jgi:hypothetical protein
MKRFKKFYEETNLDRYQILNPELTGTVKYEYKGRRAIYALHARDRFNERNRSTIDKVRWFYKNAIDWHLQNQNKYPNFYYFLLFSRKLNQGMITRWEPDTFNYGQWNKQSLDKHMIINTYLPYGKNDPNYGAKPDKPTKLIMMEHKLQNGYISKAMAMYLSGLMDIPINIGKILERHPDGISNYSKTFDNVDVTIFTIGNKVWDVDGVILGEVE